MRCFLNQLSSYDFLSPKWLLHSVLPDRKSKDAQFVYLAHILHRPTWPLSIRGQVVPDSNCLNRYISVYASEQRWYPGIFFQCARPSLRITSATSFLGAPFSMAPVARQDTGRHSFVRYQLMAGFALINSISIMRRSVLSSVGSASASWIFSNDTSTTTTSWVAGSTARCNVSRHHVYLPSTHPFQTPSGQSSR